MGILRGRHCVGYELSAFDDNLLEPQKKGRQHPLQGGLRSVLGLIAQK